MASEIGDVVIFTMTATTSVLNTTERTVDLDTEELIDADSYSTASNQITNKTDGLYLIINHLAADRGATGTNRTGCRSFLHVNGSLVTGAYTDGYIRRAGSSDEMADCAYGIYELSANDTVEMRILATGTGSAARVLGNVTTYIDAVTALTVIKLDDDAACAILECTAADALVFTNFDIDTDLEFTTQTRLDTGYTHTAGAAEITLDDPGKYIAVYSECWTRPAGTTRMGAVTNFELDGVKIPGSWDNNILRGSDGINAGSNSNAVIFETTTDDQVLTLVAHSEATTTAMTRDYAKARLCIYKLPDDVKTFNIGSTSTHDIGSTIQQTMVYDSSAWIDTGYSLASNQVTITDASNYLFLTGVTTNIGATRTEPTNWFEVDGTKILYGYGTSYSRNSGGLVRASPNAGAVVPISASDKVDVQNQSLGGHATIQFRSASTGAFIGLDLTTLASSAASYSLTAIGGSYSVTGTAAGLEVASSITAEAGVYTLTGTDAMLDYEVTEAENPWILRRRRRW